MKLSESWHSLMKTVLDEGCHVKDSTGDYLEVSMVGFNVTDFDLGNPIFGNVEESNIEEMRKVFLGGGISTFGHNYWSQIGESGQLDRAIRQLKLKPTSRKAVVVLGMVEGVTSVPCINALHFWLRGNTLHLHYFSRGQDLWLKFIPDILALRELQNIVVEQLGNDVRSGLVAGCISSAHIYIMDRPKVETALK